MDCISSTLFVWQSTSVPEFVDTQGDLKAQTAKDPDLRQLSLRDMEEADLIVVSTDPFIQAVDRLNMMRGR
jgi:hypothetical protein